MGTPNWSQDVDVAGNSKVNSTNIMFAPTIIEDEFHIYTPGGDATLVDIYTTSGVWVRHFDNECTYNVSDLAKGNYVVVVNGIDGKHILTQLIIKK